MSAKPGVKVLPLGGLGEIGMNCLVLEIGQEIYIIDCGVMFGDLEPFGFEFIIPNFRYLIENKDRVKAFLITHGHEDHIGSLPYALRAGIQAPIYASPFTAAMIESRLEEAGLLQKSQIRRYVPGETFRVGNVSIQTVPVNHSIVESSALIISTPYGRIVHTGDFRIDADPYYGKEMRFQEFKKAGDEGVLLLLSDSTNVERDDRNDSEHTIYDALENILHDTKGATFISMFSSNVGRMGQVFELASKLKKRVTVAGRSMQQNLELAYKNGYIEEARTLAVSADEIESVPRKRRIILSTGSQGEYRSAMARLAKAEHPYLEIQEDDSVVISSRFIPGNEKAVSRMINNIFRRGARVHYEPVDHVHVSGHATKPELRKMLQAVRPRFFIPVHGEYRHLVLHAELARETAQTGRWLKQALVVANGQRVEIGKEHMRVVDDLGDLGTLIEGPLRTEGSSTVLSQRRKLAEKGAASVLVTLKNGRLAADPRLLTAGVFGEQNVERGLKAATESLKAFFQKLYNSGVSPPKDLEEQIRVELRRHLNLKLGKKATVFTHVVEL